MGLDPADLPGQNDRSAWAAMRERFAAVFSTRTRDEWVAAAAGRDACLGPVLSIDEAPDHPQMRARDVYAAFDGLRHPSPAPRFDRTPSALDARDARRRTGQPCRRSRIGASRQRISPRSKARARRRRRETMKLILVRHGRPDEGDTTTPNDPPLNAEGWRQARAAAKLLASEGVTRIVASPLLRAQQTAQPLAERLGLGVETVEGWAEADRRASRYRSTETLRAEGGEAWARFLEDPIRYLGADPAEFRAGVIGALAATVDGRGSRGADRRLHAWPSDQCRALARAGAGQHHHLSGRLRLGDAAAAARRWRVWSFQHQRDRSSQVRDSGDGTE